MTQLDEQSTRDTQPDLRVQAAVSSSEKRSEGPAPRNYTGVASTGDRTYLDATSNVHGKLNFEGPVRIDGHIEGEIFARDTLIIGKSAIVTAKIKAQAITVAGVIKGEITASERIELQASAKIAGTLIAPKLVIHEGAVFDGNCVMQTKTLREERKPGTVRTEEQSVAESAKSISV